jgi:hypothetical protein
MNKTTLSTRSRGTIKLTALHDATKWKSPPRRFLIPYFLPAGATVLVTSSPDVETGIFAQLVAYCLAGGKDFLPFGAASASSVVYFSSKADPLADVKRFELFRNRDPFPSSQQRAAENLRLYFRHWSDDLPAYLNCHSDQEWFANAIPSGTALVIFDSVASWTRYGKAFDSLQSSDAYTFIERLNFEGVAVLIFDSNQKKSNPLTLSIMQGEIDNVISLTFDAGAPHEYGGGFNISRTKRDDDDTIPRMFQFWWKVVKGELDFGWELRGYVDSKASKKVEMLERQMKVDQLLAEHKSQREIAALLEVDAATISRDVAKLKEVSKSRAPVTEASASS